MKRVEKKFYDGLCAGVALGYIATGHYILAGATICMNRYFNYFYKKYNIIED